jgi:NTE family protein
MSVNTDGAHHRTGLRGTAVEAEPARGTAASRLLSATDIWSPAPSPSKASDVPEQKPAAQPPASSMESVQTESVRTEVRLVERPLVQPEAARSEASTRWPPRKLSLALQGGGTFTAFTWGVLERLLEEPDIAFDTISGASAGAINALLLACGLVEGGREGARRRLNRFWLRLMHEASFRSLMLVGGFSPAGSSVAFGPTLRSGQFDPFDLDPLRQVLSRDIDFATLRDPRSPRLLVAATQIRDGRQQVFGNDAITADVVLASTCPPLVHCAVEVDGDAYWDGGYGANPPLVRLLQESDARDVLVVQVTPSRDSYIPITMAAIDRRLDQIAANAALNAEIAAVEWVRQTAMPALRLSRIAAEDEIEGLAQRSSTDLGSGFIRLLHRSGRDAADRWLRQATSPGPTRHATGKPLVQSPEPALV